MPHLPNLDDGVPAELDIQTGRWRLSAGDQQIGLRDWTWGERRRLAWSAIVQGSFDRDVFLESFFELLTDASPVRSWRNRVACRCLQLLGVSDEASPHATRPICQSELILLQHFRWLPSDLDQQQVCVVDKLLDQLVPTASSDSRAAQGSDWTRIIVVDQSGHAEAGAGETRLNRMLAIVAKWAGVLDEYPTTPARAEKKPCQSDRDPEAELRQDRTTDLPSERMDRLPEIASVAPTPTDTLLSKSSNPRTFPGIARLQARKNASIEEPPPNRTRSASNSQNAFASALVKLAPRAPRESIEQSNAHSQGPLVQPRELTQPKTDSRGPAVPLRNPSLGKTRRGSGLLDPPNVTNSPATLTPPGLSAIRVSAAGPVWLSRSQHASIPSASFPDAFDVVEEGRPRPTGNSIETWPREGERFPSTDLRSIPPASPFLSDPAFVLDEFETQLADTLERAAREQGVEVP